MIVLYRIGAERITRNGVTFDDGCESDSFGTLGRGLNDTADSSYSIQTGQDVWTEIPNTDCFPESRLTSGLRHFIHFREGVKIINGDI